MKRSDITDEQVVLACVTSRERPFSALCSLDFLVGLTGAPYKVAFAAMERADKRGFIDYGVSLRTAFPTQKGLQLLRATSSSGSAAAAAAAAEAGADTSASADQP